MPNAKNANEHTAHRFLILGDTGSGKTTQMLTLPGKTFAYLFDSNALLSLRGHDIDYEEFLPDQLNLSVQSLSKSKGGDKNSNHSNLVYSNWEQDFNERMADGFFDIYDNVGFDSATTFLDLIMDRILTINGRAGQWPQQDDYGPQMVAFTNVVRTLVSMGKTIYMTGHLEYQKDKLTERVYRQPVMTGKLRTKIPLLFSDIFVSGVTNDGQGNISHTLQTVPDRVTTSVRSSFKGLSPNEDVSLDFTKPLKEQGLGLLLSLEKEGKL